MKALSARQSGRLHRTTLAGLVLCSNTGTLPSQAKPVGQPHRIFAGSKLRAWLASLPPCLAQDANPISPGDLLNDVFAITAGAHGCQQRWQAGCIADCSRHGGAVKV